MTFTVRPSAPPTAFNVTREPPGVKLDRMNPDNLALPLARTVLNEKRVDHRCVITETPVHEKQPGFWKQLLVDPSFDGLTDLEKLVAGCEIIVALDDLDLLAAR